MSDDADRAAFIEVLDAIVAQHGGVDGLTVPQRLIARRLAHALVTDSEFDTRVISDLMAMLPAVAGPSAPDALDLSSLDDVDFGQLAEILGRAGLLADLETSPIEATLAAAADALDEMAALRRRATVAEAALDVLRCRAARAEEAMRLAGLALTARDLTGLCRILAIEVCDLFNAPGAPGKAGDAPAGAGGYHHPSGAAEGPSQGSPRAPRARPVVVPLDVVGAAPPYAPNPFAGLVDERIGLGDRFANRL
jgi:hypothetical protein